MTQELQVRWTPSALRDLREITRYIRRDSPIAARAVAQKLFNEARSLSSLPGRGRTGRIENTRELIVPHLPYIIVYQIDISAIQVLRVYHAARNWPEYP
jgi:toxin ParE1/3/4